MGIERKINELMAILQEGPVFPGGIRESFGTCGKPNCKCKDIDDPKLHGPYSTLSFSLKEKSSSMSLSKNEAPLAKKMVERFKKAKSLLNELGIAYVEEGRGNNVSILTVPELGEKKKRGKSEAEKKRSKEQSIKNEDNRIKIKNLKRDLERSKNKCDKIKEEKQSLKIEVNSLKSKTNEQEEGIRQLEANRKKKY